MLPQSDEQEHKHLLPFWMRWFIVLFVLLIIAGGTVLWIIQGTQTIIPVAIFTALGVLFTFFQVLLSIFPSVRHKRPVTPPHQLTPDRQHVFPASSFPQPAFSKQTHPSDIIE